MTHNANARLAGFTFLAYIATGITQMVVFARASAGSDPASRLLSIATHASAIRLSALLALLTFFEAVILGVTLYALTRDGDRDLALFALCCRAAEGVLGASAAVRTLQELAAANLVAAAPSSAPAITLGTWLISSGGSSSTIGAICFAAGSTVFSYLFLRLRNIPVALAWLGVVASAVLVIALPTQLAGYLPTFLAWPIWLPMLVFEVTLAFWLIIRGVRAIYP